MALIHDRSECLTGCQDRSPWSEKTDLQYDFIMVYGLDAEMPNRIRAYRDHGYVVHLMTGSAWGDYQDYLDGDWDGVNHWDESQCGRDGQPIMHGVNSPYICPSPAFARYLTEKLKPAVDAGVEAVHLEEPEFWDAGGYGAEFRRAWKDYYGEDWQPPHASCEGHHKAAALKVYLFRRLLASVSAGIKAYAESRGRKLSFYVPTHSLVNYTQWKILSPEGTLLDIPTVDGFIAQVWTGTSRAGNVYRGRYDERTFETAFLEYGIARELARGSGRRIWFLHDPVEDNPEYTWENFRENYLKTVAASLMFPDVTRFEVAPWPDRVFNGVYPKKGRLTGEGLLPGQAMEGAKPIPEAYAQLICAMIQTLGDMAQADCGFDLEDPRVGLLMADSGLYQRSFPDTVSSHIGEEGMNQRLFSLKDRQRAGEDTRADSAALMKEISENPALYHDYIVSGAFPHFFGLVMPIIKAGLPLRLVQMENILRVNDCLSEFSSLILSYEWMKPRDPREHEALADWIRQGGTLLVVGDGSDPCHEMKSWWNPDGKPGITPLRHLWRTLGLEGEPAEGAYPVQAGRIIHLSLSPARITLTAAAHWLHQVLTWTAPDFTPRNYFLMRRGPYRIAAVMKESVSEKPLTLRGCFVDLLEKDFPLVASKTIQPGETTLLYDLDAMETSSAHPVAATARILSLREDSDGYALECRAAAGVPVRIRLRLPCPVLHAEAWNEQDLSIPVELLQWDDSTRTLLIGLPGGLCGLRIKLFCPSCPAERKNLADESSAR